MPSTSPRIAIKEWYIYLDNMEEGPFSILELRRDPRLTPDTLAWREGLTA